MKLALLALVLLMLVAGCMDGKTATVADQDSIVDPIGQDLWPPRPPAPTPRTEPPEKWSW